MTLSPASGFPESGPGSVAGFGTRILAFVVDSVVSVAVALAAGYRPGSTGYQVVVLGGFLAIEFLFVSIAGI